MSKNAAKDRARTGLATGRLSREARTVEHMIRLYCAAQHQENEALCPQCAQLLQYAHKRLALCPQKGNRTVCAKCPTHCYGPGQKEAIRAVMRYAGPRLIWSHPILTLLHFIDGFRAAAQKK